MTQQLPDTNDSLYMTLKVAFVWLAKRKQLKKNSMTSIISASKGMCDHESGLDSFFFFFLSGFSFTNIHDSRDSRGRGRVSI